MENSAPSVRLLHGGFTERGAQVTRLEAFVDAAFAFSLTLLVISFDAIPDSMPALLEALKGVPAFALCFTQIALFWHAHVNWTRRYGLDDLPSMLLSLSLVFLILIYVYPLKLMFGTFFSWITSGWIPWPMKVSSFQDIIDMFVIYGIAFVTLSLCIAGLYGHAYRRRRGLRLSVDETVATLGEIALWTWGMFVGGLSVIAALLMPLDPPFWLSGLPGMVYFLMNLTPLVSRAAERRARLQLERESRA